MNKSIHMFYISETISKLLKLFTYIGCVNIIEYSLHNSISKCICTKI